MVSFCLLNCKRRNPALITNERRPPTGVYLSVMYFIILAAAITSVYVLRKKKSQQGDLQTSGRKLTKKSSPESIRYSNDESFRDCEVGSFMVNTPAIPKRSIWSIEETLASYPKGMQHTVSTQGAPVTITHSNSTSKASSRSCDSTSTMLDPFRCYNYPLQAQSLVPHFQALRSLPAAHSYSPKQHKNPFSSIKSSFTSSRNEWSPTNFSSNSSCLSSTPQEDIHFNSLKSSSTSHRQERNATDAMKTISYSQKSQVHNDYPCGIRDAAKLRKTLKSHASSATGVTSPSSLSSLLGAYSSLNTLVPEMSSYAAISSLGRSEKTFSFQTMKTTDSGITSFLENYAYE